MAIPQGITLIAGGGYHGKSTLLTALEDGVYNHIAGDGREFVLTDSSAVKLRAEDGRFIKDVDISLFINDLPNGKDTHCFSTLDASGSTSQAAGIVEGMEAGSTLFLLDEDTSATNFMVRDGFMQQVISRDKEPITPFLERAPQLFSKAGISTILVAGSSGAFFHIADTVIQMDRYQALDITEKVKKLCSDYPLPPSSVPSFYMPSSKRVMSSTKKASYKDFKMKCHGKDSFSIGKDTVDLRYIEQLTDKEQTAALGELLRYAQEYLVDGKRTISEIISVLQNKIEKDGFSAFFGNSYIPCGLAVPRIQEIFSCGWSSEDEVAGEIRSRYEKDGYLCDTHTAVAFHVAAQKKRQGVPMVVLSTASPFKFPRSVLSALGKAAPENDFEAMQQLEAATGHAAPASLAALRSKPERFDTVIAPAQIAEVALGYQA